MITRLYVSFRTSRVLQVAAVVAVVAAFATVSLGGITVIGFRRP